MMWKRLTATFCGLAIIGTTACMEVDEHDPKEIDSTGAQLITQVNSKSDVEAFKYSIFECSDDYNTVPIIQSEPIPLKENITLPGGLDEFINKPFAPNSHHLFADYFVLIDAGCYDVLVEPYTTDEQGHHQPSNDCIPALMKGLEVVDGHTTEELLVSQCAGEERGALDIIAALNHPPKIDIVDLDPQKFVACPVDEDDHPTLEICVQASDPDKDPMHIDWGELSGPDGDFENIGIDGVKQVIPGEFTSSQGIANQCITIEFERKNIALEAEITVFDKFLTYSEDNEQYELTTAEHWFAENMDFKDENGDPLQVKSRASLTFPIYVLGCDEEFVCGRSLGYWKQKRNWSVFDDNDDIDFDFNETKLCDIDSFEGELWSAILNGPTGGQFMSQYYNLARQYITARLNQAIGATSSPEIEQAIDEAEAILERSCDQDAGHRHVVLEGDETVDSINMLKDLIENEYNTFCQFDPDDI